MPNVKHASRDLGLFGLYFELALTANGERNKTEREDARKCKKTTDKGGRSASRTHQIHTTTG